LALLLPLIALVLGAARPACAHSVGISRGDYRLRGSQVEVELVFARSELARAIPGLDADRDGVISAHEIADSQGVIDEVILRGIALQVPSGLCVGTLQDVSLTEEDGLAIRAVYRCSETPKTLSFQWQFLRDLSHGHRHLATVTAARTTLQIIVYEGNASFHLPAIRDTEAEQGTTVTMLWSLLLLGVEHILTGYDHLVFLLGLILVSGRLRQLFGVVTAFTVAHSITLGLATLDVWAPSPTVIEPAIALSIVYVGVENWFIKDARHRWLITFPFGLIHGFGFAGALQEISLPVEQIPLALVVFNSGVEVGQIAVLAALLPGILWLRRQQWFFTNGVKGMSAGVAVAGAWWFVTRVV
jgi:hydrogenase/urease accessory protein HupE